MGTVLWSLAEFYIVWAMLLGSASYLRYRGLWRPDLRTASWAVTLARQVEIALLPAPALFGVWYILIYDTARLRVFAMWNPPEIAMAFLICQPLLAAAIAWPFARAERRAAGDPDSRNLRRTWWIKTRWHLYTPLILTAMVTVAGFFMGLIILWFVRLALTLWGRRSATSGFELEPTPLREEMIRIAADFGVRLSGLRVRPARKPRSRLEVPLLEPIILGARGDSRNARVIPLVHFQELDPDVLTAALAHQWARTVNSGSFLGDVNEGVVSRSIAKLFAGGCGCVVFVFLIIGGMTVLTPLARNTTSAVPGILAFFYVSALALGIPYIIARTMGGLPTAYEAHRNALTAWQMADPEAGRDPITYAVAIGRYRAYAQAISRPEVALLQLRRDQALMQLLEASYPGARDQAFEAVREAVVEPSNNAEVLAG